MGRYLSGLRAAHHRRTLLSGGQSYALKAVLDRCLTLSLIHISYFLDKMQEKLNERMLRDEELERMRR